jgi:outer membrane protein assembly factor BamB
LRLTPIVLALVLVAGPALATGWAQENAHHRNGGQLDQATANSLDDARLTSLDGRPLAQPAEGPAGLTVIGTVSGQVAAVDADGETAWTQDLGDEIRTTPAWTGETIVVLPRGEQAYGLAPTGDVAWTLPVDNDRDASLVRMASPALHPSGDVVLATLAGEVHRVTPDGEEAWRAEVGGPESIQATPAITDDGDVIVAAFEPGREGHGLLARLDGDTGDEEWRVEIDAQVVGAPTIYADTVLVPIRDQRALEARSLSDGSLRWSEAFDDRVTASPSLASGLAIVGDVSGNLRALDADNGREEWSFNPIDDDPDVDPVTGAAYTVADSAAVDDGVAWAPYWVADLSTCCPPTDSEPSPLYRLDAASGEMLDRYENPKAIHGPGLLETGVWAGSDEDGLRAWANDPSLQLHAVGLDQRVLTVTNTAHEGAWEIAAEGETLADGEGQPPAVATYQLEPGETTVTVTVDGEQTAQNVTVEGQTDDEEEPDPVDEAIDDEPEANGTEDPDTDEPEPEPEPDDTEQSPVAFPLAAGLLAAIAAAGVRARA